MPPLTAKICNDCDADKQLSQKLSTFIPKSKSKINDWTNFIQNLDELKPLSKSDYDARTELLNSEDWLTY